LNSRHRRQPGRPSLRSIRKRIHRFLRAGVEISAVAITGQIIPRLSRRSTRRLARALGWTLFTCGRQSRRIALANLDILFGNTRTPEEKKALALASFRHTALIVLDYFWFSRRTHERLAAYCRSEDPRVEKWICGDFPGFFVTAHIGNWELAGQYVSSRGRALWSVYRRIGTRKTLKTLLRFRRATGQRVIAREGAMQGMLRALHENDLVAVVLDQHTDVADGGIYLDFFGLPATFSNAVGMLAKRRGVPVCVGCVHHDVQADVYRLLSYDEITTEEIEGLSPEAITARIVVAIQRMILDAPEQWLLAYRRWKRCPPGDDGSRFPFYTRQDSRG